jgi:hypothetical protein
MIIRPTLRDGMTRHRKSEAEFNAEAEKVWLNIEGKGVYIFSSYVVVEIFSIR